MFMNPIRQSGPWLLSTTTTSMSIGSILLAQDSKRYAKFEVILDTQVIDLSILDFVLLIEIAISDPITPVLSNSAKNILKKFPSWMKMYEDSEDQASEDTFIPNSVGGKFVNSVLNDTLDFFDTQIDLHNINRFINSADLSQLAWIYSSLNVPNVFNKVYGDGIELAKIDDILDLYEAKESDYVYYHNPINREIITIKKYSSLYTSNYSTGQTQLIQGPLQKFNWFDEFGARVGLNRMYLEDNTSFKFRILDVFLNPIDTTIDGFKRTLRREMDLWKAYGATPDHTTQYATPVIMEMQDIEASIEYFNIDGSPKQKFIDLVRVLNEKYPTNWGYFRFNNALWDIAGFEQEGVERIASRYYDDLNDFSHYQAGVGDLSDAEIIILDNSATPVSFQTKLLATGKQKIGTSLDNSPIKFDYEYFGKYDEIIYDNNSATVNLTLEAVLKPYANIVSDTNIYTNITKYVKNEFSPTSSASPEYLMVDIFDSEGYVTSDLTFNYKSTTEPVVLSFNDLYTSTQIPHQYLSNIVLKNGLWNGSTYATPNTDQFSAMFSHKPDVLRYDTSSINASTPDFNENTSIKLISNLYNPKTVQNETVRIKDTITINSTLDGSTSNVDLPMSVIKSNIIFPASATPISIHIEGLDVNAAYDSPGPIDDTIIDNYGGVSYYSELDRDLFVPSSPNIVASMHGNSLPSNTFGFISSENAGATVNYHFAKLSYLVSSTPNSITISTQSGDKYPFETIQWEPFEAYSTDYINGTVDEKGIVRYSAQNGERIPGLNDNLITLPEISRESFGISGSTKFNYFFETIKVIDPADVNVSVWSDQKIVKPFLNRTYVLESSIIDAINNTNDHIEIVDYPTNSIIETYDSESGTTLFGNIKVRAKLYDNKIDSKINTGWISINKEDQYIYAKPVTETFTGRLSKLTLMSNPTHGAPVILDVVDNNATPLSNYKEVAFSDSATPGLFSFYNVEVLSPKADNSFYLGYQDVYNVSIRDLNTGELVVTNLTSSTNQVTVPTSIANLVTTREYRIGYRVNNSYYIDTELYNDDYQTSIYFDSTPSYDYTYSVTYESSDFEMATPISIDMNPLTSWMDEGFISIVKDEYDFSELKVKLSPSYVINDSQDYVDISIISIDINGNPKPNQTFDISTTDLISTLTRITTDQEGYAHLTVTSDSVITEKTYGSITFTGVNYSNDSTADVNSQSGAWLSSHLIEVIAQNTNSGKSIKASVSDKVIKADGISTVYVKGVATEDGVAAAGIAIYWRKDRDIYSIFNDTSYSATSEEIGSAVFSGMVYTDSEGKFEIGPILSSSKINPGYWFVSVESEFSTLPNISPTTIAGDIVYWLEEYDSINYNFEVETRLIDVVNFNVEKSLDLYATPNFIVSYYNQDVINVQNQTPLWNPPKWFAVSRYEQYQSGLLGNTPYDIENYDSLIKDYEEE